MHPLLILLIVSLTASFLFIRGNLARYWAENKDTEQLQYETDKAAGKPCINPVKQDNKHLLLLFLLVVGLIAVVWLICNSID